MSSLFLFYITCHLNVLNVKLQGEGQLVHQLYSHVKRFKNKTQSWEGQLRNGTTFHFLTLENHVKCVCSSFADDLVLLNKEFSDRFQELRSQKTHLRIFASPFHANGDLAPEELQVELLEHQGNEDLKGKMRDLPLLEVYKNLFKVQDLNLFGGWMDLLAIGLVLLMLQLPMSLSMA